MQFDPSHFLCGVCVFVCVFLSVCLIERENWEYTVYSDLLSEGKEGSWLTFNLLKK